ncbi:MAG TPA: MoaD/ThiS family protein [Aggregatilineales bacterium]|nr:MoaD/ThiS family protein [Aggregatilineales bacterium]
MTTTIKIPAPLRVYTGDQAEIPVEGQTVQAALDDLLKRYPDLRAHLFNEGELRNFVNIFVGEEDIRYRDGLDTPLEPGEKLRIIPTIAGGISAGGYYD